nr:hypothetical protein DA06_16330 [Georgenia sp. SUBG003]
MHDLRVAGVAQHVGEPAQLGAQRVRPAAVQDVAERLQGGAQPPGGDTHLVHRVRGAQPHARVRLRQCPRLGGEVGQHHVGRRRPPAQPRRRNARRCSVAQRPQQLRGHGRELGAGVPQHLLEPVEETGFAAGQLHLQLAPAGHGDPVAERLPGDAVVHQLREDGSVRRAVPDEVDRPAGADPRHRHEPGVPDVDGDEVPEPVRRGRALRPEGLTDLRPAVRAAGQLEVPAVVHAPRPTAERDAPGGQAQVRGVDVGAVQLELGAAVEHEAVGHLHAVEPEGLVHGELALHLELGVHDLIPVVGPPLPVNLQGTRAVATRPRARGDGGGAGTAGGAPAFARSWSSASTPSATSTRDRGGRR